MSDVRAIVPSRLEDWTELDDSSNTIKLGRKPQGRLYEKHILNKGTLLHPATGKPLQIDDEFVRKLKQNFDKGVCDIVQVPIAGERNQHTEDPTRNLGEVVDIRERDGKVYAVIDARDERFADKLGKTLLGASAMLSTDYLDTRTGTKVGPTLLHVCVTNRPYITNLEDYQEIVAASADSPDEDAVVYVSSDEEETLPEQEVIEASAPEIEENVKMTLEEMLAALKAEHNIDVPALQAAASQADAMANLTNAVTATIAEALADTGTVELSNPIDEVTVEDLVGGIADLAKFSKQQAKDIHELKRNAAKVEVEALVKSGHVLPTQVDALTELKLSAPDTFEKLIPAEPIVKLSVETGVTPVHDELQQKATEDEVDRYLKLSRSYKPVSGRKKK